MKANYTVLAQTIAALTEGETDQVALMATVTCELHHADDRFDWTGFYRVVAPELLKIGPYQGGHGCLVIPFSRGVCGAAARRGLTGRKVRLSLDGGEIEIDWRDDGVWMTGATAHVFSGELTAAFLGTL